MTVREMRAELAGFFVERADLTDGMMAALLCKEHVMILGPPGTAKSMIAQAICKGIVGAEYFHWLLTKFTTPEEIFGPVSLKGLEEDRYRRISRGKLPEAHVAFLDEVFKANSSILNALLTVMNERIFHNDDEALSAPLVTLVGASNEFPDTDELKALYDRFLLRFQVEYIGSRDGFTKMLRSGDEPLLRSRIELADLRRAQEEASSLPLREEIIELVADLRQALGDAGVVVSDRRFKKGLGLLRAHAYMISHPEVEPSDLLVLRHVLWTDPRERETVDRVLFGLVHPRAARALELLAQGEDVVEKATRRWGEEKERSDALEEGWRKVKALVDETREMLYEEGGEGPGREKIAGVLRRLEELHGDLKTGGRLLGHARQGR